jgi:hypothetical protein
VDILGNETEGSHREGANLISESLITRPKELGQGNFEPAIKNLLFPFVGSSV